MRLRLKSLLPRGLYGRAALILIVPIVTIQLVVSIAFIQRHYDGVTRQMARTVLVELDYVLTGLGPEGGEGVARAAALGIEVSADASVPVSGDMIGRFDWSGRALADELYRGLAGLSALDLVSEPRRVRLWVRPAGHEGEVLVSFARARVTASNPHQLLAVMLLASILLTGVAFLFLRNQLVPITRLARAAEAFGRGETLPYRPRGAAEVRAAGAAFLAMRARIERQIEARTLMLSGVSHDLRTPLTRMKLALAVLPEGDEEVKALRGDVEEMERLVESFLAFARGDSLEATETADPLALLAGVVERARRLGTEVEGPLGTAGPTRMRPQAVARALDNLAGNAARHGRRMRASLRESATTLTFTIEDDGPGIPPELRDRAVEPFQRLEPARDPNRGGGVGLGLSIAADIARAHGGALRLSASMALGGLKAELSLPRATG